MPDHTLAPASKAELRRAVLAARDALSPRERRDRSLRILARLRALPALQQAQAVLSFASFRSEVDMAPVNDWLLSRGTLLALPRVRTGREMDAWQIADLRGDLTPGLHGIPEPRDGLELVEPATFDAVLMPGVAFDPRGGRVGYGGGFYDTYLPHLRDGALRIAAAFDVQVVACVPRDGHDLPVDLVVTESQTLTAPPAASGGGD